MSKNLMGNTCTVKEDLNVYGNSNLLDVTVKGVLSINNLLLNTPTEKGYILTSNGHGYGEWKPMPKYTPWVTERNIRDDIYYEEGFVGIGTKNPEKRLHVTDNAKFDGFIETSDIFFTEKNSTISKNDCLFIKSYEKTVFTINSNNYVGINQEFPTESLDIEGSLKFTGNIIHKENTFLFPNEPDTLVGEDQPQTLRMKTLISSNIESPIITNPIINGNIQLNGTISGVKQPVNKDDVANREYVDMLTLTGSLIFLDNVSDFVKEIPKKPQIDERFIFVGDNDNKNKIMIWTGLEWEYETPEQNNILYVDRKHSQYIFIKKSNKWIVYTSLTSHSNLQNLYLDDHPQYFNIHGRKGGQSIIAGLKSGDMLTIESTAHMNKGPILLNPNNGNVGIHNKTPKEKLDVDGNIKLTGSLVNINNKKFKLPENNTDSQLISKDSTDILKNKTLDNPIIHGILHSFRYNVVNVRTSRMLTEKDQVLLISSSITLTLPEASKNGGRKYTFIINKNRVKCIINLLDKDRININSKTLVLTEIHKPKSLLSDGLYRWYTI